MRCHHGATTPPCTPSRCYWRVAVSPNVSTTPKMASEVNIPSYASPVTPVRGWCGPPWMRTMLWRMTSRCCIHQSAAWCSGRMMAADVSLRGGLNPPEEAPGREYQVDIGEEEETLETIDPTWRTTHWLQLVVQGILDDEVPWAECVIPLTVGTKESAVSLAKCLLAIWRWSIKVQGWDVCPPALTALNIGQFMTWEEVLENVDTSLWLMAYSHTLQRVGEAAHG